MKKIIITISILLLSLFLLVGCINPYQIKLNAHLIDKTNIGQLNDCTKLDSCDGWKCLCDNMANENNYCQRYEDFCVSTICEEITININGVSLMERHFNDKYSGCVFVYDKVVEIDGIEIKEISDEYLTCLSEFRNNMDIPDKHIYGIGYSNGKFINNEGEVIKC